MMRIQRYDQCGELVSGFDVQPGTFISREAFLSIDSKDDVIAFHSFSESEREDNPCHIAKVSSNIRSESSLTPLVSLSVSLLGLIITAKFSSARSST